MGAKPLLHIPIETSCQSGRGSAATIRTVPCASRRSRCACVTRSAMKLDVGRSRRAQATVAIRIALCGSPAAAKVATISLS